MVGKPEGCGVGLPNTYVGDVVGEADGDTEGLPEGSGVGLPATKVGTIVGFVEGVNVG